MNKTFLFLFFLALTSGAPAFSGVDEDIAVAENMLRTAANVKQLREAKGKLVLQGKKLQELKNPSNYNKITIIKKLISEIENRLRILYEQEEAKSENNDKMLRPSTANKKKQVPYGHDVSRRQRQQPQDKRGVQMQNFEESYAKLKKLQEKFPQNEDQYIELYNQQLEIINPIVVQARMVEEALPKGSDEVIKIEKTIEDLIAAINEKDQDQIQALTENLMTLTQVAREALESDHQNQMKQQFPSDKQRYYDEERIFQARQQEKRAPYDMQEHVNTQQAMENAEKVIDYAEGILGFLEDKSAAKIVIRAITDKLVSSFGSQDAEKIKVFTKELNDAISEAKKGLGIVDEIHNQDDLEQKPDVISHHQSKQQFQDKQTNYARRAYEALNRLHTQIGEKWCEASSQSYRLIQEMDEDGALKAALLDYIAHSIEISDRMSIFLSYFDIPEARNKLADIVKTFNILAKEAEKKASIDIVSEVENQYNNLMMIFEHILIPSVVSFTENLKNPQNDKKLEEILRQIEQHLQEASIQENDVKTRFDMMERAEEGIKKAKKILNIEENIKEDLAMGKQWKEKWISNNEREYRQNSGAQYAQYQKGQQKSGDRQKLSAQVQNQIKANNPDLLIQDCANTLEQAQKLQSKELATHINDLREAMSDVMEGYSEKKTLELTKALNFLKAMMKKELEKQEKEKSKNQ
ncbi:hypothetical protein [Candidatus Hydrogenosomobacter endosymbioticus]|uniref:Uncharacterized protein n=1 Tax=Candidatus Hydrogenosomobacter endosymbioticus TaxID=2558174 RepID=A0ABM7V9C9_9PROT|nr:hypothetical protein [Candidatus Hydrogenosomobacter endosymbioticus]BDB96376.1 hypothetical protein HYD_5090 [Candidatus Hydrogenosomobacter endosymbioticus]